MIFGCTDLRIGASEAKFYARLDFEVYLAVAPQKPYNNCEKHIFGVTQLVGLKFSDVKT